jgi:hypothetical protein
VNVHVGLTVGHAHTINWNRTNVWGSKMGQQKLTREDIEKILKDVKFMDRTFLLLDKDDGFLVQMSYMEPDVENPEAGSVEQKTRKWYVSPYMTETEIVETCWAMVQRSMMHIAGEHFKYRGKRVYSPHFDIYARLYLCDHNCFDARDPIEPAPK